MKNTKKVKRLNPFNKPLGWCVCGKSWPEGNEYPYYVPNDVDPRCSHHHWKCPSCHQLTQVG